MVLAFVIAACLSAEPPPPPAHVRGPTAHQRHHDPDEANRKFAPLRALEAQQRKQHKPVRVQNRR